jgi:hypothetical protein
MRCELICHKLCQVCQKVLHICGQIMARTTTIRSKIWYKHDRMCVFALFREVRFSIRFSIRCVVLT